MSLKSSFKTNAAAANEGVWVDFTSHPNKDGTIPGFLLARVSKQNKRYQAAIREVTRDTGLTVEGLPDVSGIPDGALAEVFANTVVLDWRNFQPEDDGFALPYTKDAAVQIFTDPNWADLYDHLVSKAQAAATFREKATDAAAKNS